MTPATLLPDLLAVSAQMVCVAAVASIVALVVRIDTASVRYQYWRCVLVFCLLLPGLQHRPIAGTVVEAIPSIGFSPTGIDTYPIVSVPPASAGLPWLFIIAWTIVVGIVLRFARIAVGLVQLRRFRRSGWRLPPDPEHAELQWALGTDAEIRYVREGHPITCGAWRPVVLLPASLLKHPVLVQRAVLVHELLHVQRRDWIWVMAEEIVRSILWFNPAVWWLVSRIRRAREEVVDELTVLATHHRRAYLEALLAFADAAPFASAAFARRTHLFHRMMLISKEAVMSSKRVVASCAVLACAVITGSWYAVGAFPMQAAQQPQRQPAGVVQPAAQAQPSRVGGPGPLEQSAKPITPENPIPRRTYSVMPQYPGDTDQGAVVLTLRVTVNALGRVAEVRSMTGGVGGRGVARGVAPGGRATNAPAAFNQDFAKAATDAVRQWIYDPPADPPISFDVTLGFTPGTEARLLAHGGQPGIGAGSGRIGAGGGGVVGGIPGGVVGGVVGGLSAAPPPPPPPPPPPGWAQGAIRVGGNVPPPTKTKHVNPVYPAIAQSARVQGVVIIEAIIGPDGHVQDQRILRSIPLLDEAALDAVKQWEFTPVMLNGSPVAVIMTVTVQFTLQ